MRININNWKVLNNSLPLFSLFCFLGCLYLGARVDYWYFLLLILIPFTIRKVRLNWKQIMLLFVIVLVFTTLILFAWKFSLIQTVIISFKNATNDIIHKSLFNFFDTQYIPEVSSFIKLILFNVKSEQTYEFLKQTIDLGIVWLICISGFHLSLLVKVIKLLFKRNKIAGKYVSIFVIAIYSFLLNFSYASIRILLKLCLDDVMKRFKMERFDKIGFIGLLICLLNPSCFSNYSFLLTFAICIGANCVAKLELNNKIISSLLININSFVITIPFVIAMNHKISLFTFINSFVFSYFSSFIFLYFIIFAWMPFMQIVHKGIIICAYVLVGNISFSNIYIWCNTWPSFAIALYYILLVLISYIIYLIVYNNKI